MKHFPIIEAVTFNVLLASCATTEENTHLHCAEYGPQSVATPYCCYYKDGYCQRTCYNYEIKNTCINWECDEGFLKKIIGISSDGSPHCLHVIELGTCWGGHHSRIDFWIIISFAQNMYVDKNRS